MTNFRHFHFWKILRFLIHFSIFDQFVPIFWKMFCFLANFPIFDQFLTNFPIFDQFSDFWPIFRCLTNIPIFDQFSDFEVKLPFLNSIFWQKSETGFLAKIGNWIFGKNRKLDFWQKKNRVKNGKFYLQSLVQTLEIFCQKDVF